MRELRESREAVKTRVNRFAKRRKIKKNLWDQGIIRSAFDQT